MKIFLCDLTYDQQVIATDSMPTSIGYVASYLLKHSRYDHQVELIKYPGDLIQKIESGDLPDLIGFSHFMWNERMVCAFAKLIKKEKPEVIVVFGGLNYPLEDHKRREWFAKNPYVDFHVLKEGELSFHALVDCLADNDLDPIPTKQQDIPGTHYIRPSGSFHNPPPAGRIKDLSAIPSPYQLGLLDKFFDGKLYPMLTTNRGCPFTCTFCAEGQSYYNHIHKSSLQRIKDDIEYIARKIVKLPSGKTRKDVFITDSNFGMYSQDLLVAEALNESYKKYGWPSYVMATTGKNKPDRVLEVARILEGKLCLTGAVQSLDTEVLDNVKRHNIRADDLMTMALESREIGSDSYSDVILGLPGDSLSAHKKTVAQIINSRFDYLTLYQLRLQADCEMATDEYREQYGLKGKYRVLARSFASYPIRDSYLNIAEIEEVCVEGIKLPFEDYLQARIFDLFVSIFYFEQIFEGLLDLLSFYDVERFAFIEKVLEIYPRFKEMVNVVDEFVEATENELSSDYDSLADDVSTRKGIQRYLDEKSGINVLGYYRIRSLANHQDIVQKIAKLATQECITQKQKIEVLPDNLNQFISELACFETERKRGRFDIDLDSTQIKFQYDVDRFMRDKNKRPPEQYKFGSKKTVTFSRSQEVSELAAKNASIFGITTMGCYTQSIRTPWKHLWRTVSHTG